MNVFELNKDKALTHLFISTSMNKNKEKKEDSHEEIYRDNFDDKCESHIQEFLKNSFRFLSRWLFLIHKDACFLSKINTSIKTPFFGEIV